MGKRVLILTFLVLAPLIAQAQGVSFTTERGNIYSAGGSVNIAESVSNDIVAAAGHLAISGNAGNELLAAGGSIMFTGKTGGDARIAGGTITSSGVVNGEAVFAGGTIHLLPDAVIKHDLFAAAGNLTIEGTIEGGAKIIGEKVLISGTINRDVEVKADRLIIGKNAKINGDLRYQAPREATRDPGAIINGKTTYTQTEFEPPRETFIRFLWVAWLVKLIAIMTAALVVYFTLKEKVSELTAFALNRFGRETLTGFVILIVVPAAILLSFITVIGWVLGLLSLFFYIAFVILSGVLGSLVFTRLLTGYLFKKEASLTWPLILLGVLIYQVIGLVPLFGWIIKFLFLLAALGSLSRFLYLRMNNATVAGESR